LAAFKQIPAKFWNDTNNVYRDYLTGNPFDLSIYDPHENHPNPGYKNNPDKSIFIAKLLSYKKQLSQERNPENKARLNYIIGNSYYSMTYNGKFWLMSKLWWGVNLDEGNLNPKETAFNRDYYESGKALYYYRQAFNLTKDPKKMAFYCLYVSQCEKDKALFWAYYKHLNQPNNVEYGDIKNKNVFAGLNRLRERKGDEDFFRLLIKECPLYLDFKRRL
jgi:hypothetical protein